MDQQALSPDVGHVLELVGVYVFASAGALSAIRKGFDITGILVLAIATSLGGGVLRDLILGATPPVAFALPEYLVMPFIAAFVTFFAHPLVARLNYAILLFDAAGLGLFTVVGT